MQTLFIHIKELIPMDYEQGFIRANELDQIKVIEDAYLLVEDGIVKDYGSMKDAPNRFDLQIINVHNKVITPGLVDSISPLYKRNAFKEKATKDSYLELLNEAQTIIGSSSFEGLVHNVEQILEQTVKFGVTTIDLQTMYADTLDTEEQLLQVLNSVRTHQHRTITSMLSKSFDVERYELILKRHAGEYHKVGCLVSDQTVPAKDAEHIMKHTLNDIRKEIYGDLFDIDYSLELGVKEKVNICRGLNKSTPFALRRVSEHDLVVGIAPIQTLYLGAKHDYLKELITQNAILSVQSAFDGITSPSFNLQYAMEVMHHSFGFSIEAVWHMATINAAYALGTRAGTLKVGSHADFIVWNVSHHKDVFHHLALNDVKEVYIKGEKQ